MWPFKSRGNAARLTESEREARRERAADLMERSLVWATLLGVFVLVAGAVAWFIAVLNSTPSLDAGQAFIGLGYIAGSAVVVGLALWFATLVLSGFAGDRETREAIHRARSARDQRFVRWLRRAPGGDHQIVLAQLRIGAGLVVAGAVAAIVGDLVLGSKNGTALAIGTAVIGAGAVLLPASSAATASSRILDSLPNRAARTPEATTGAVIGTATADLAQVQITIIPAGATGLTAFVEWGEQDGSTALTAGQAVPASDQASSTLEFDLKPLGAGKKYQYTALVRTSDGRQIRGATLKFEIPS